MAQERWGGRYVPLELLGRGAQGQVFRALDVITGGHVALKSSRVDDADADASVRTESITLRMLRMSGVVPILDEGTRHDRSFLVMRIVDGSHFPGAKRHHPVVAVSVESHVSRRAPRKQHLATELDRLDRIDAYLFVLHGSPALYRDPAAPRTRRLELISAELPNCCLEIAARDPSAGRGRPQESAGVNGAHLTIAHEIGCFVAGRARPTEARELP